MRCPKWISAQQLDRWAATPQARHTFPELLRRLVYATVEREDLKSIDFPSGAEVQRPGYDGTTVVTKSTPFVPDGVAFWELGCKANPGKKAQDDYDIRVTEHKERIAKGETENLAEATFIAATALDWQKAEEWAKARRADEVYKGVRAYDSNRLEQWIQDAPAVGLWLLQEMGQKCNGVLDIGSQWGIIQATLRRPLPPKVLLVNRESISTAFEDWLNQPSGELAVKAPSGTELVAVFCAWVQSLPQDRQDQISSRTIIVESRESWRELATSQQRLILVAAPRIDGDADLFADAYRQGHHVLRYAEFRTPPRQATELPMMRRFDLQQTLESAGLSPAEARQLAESAGGNFTILRRRFAKTADAAPWARDSSLAPLLLAAAWEDGRADDQRIVALLADRKYSDVQSTMKKWRSEPDAPVRLALGTWEFLSPVDAWEALSHYLTSEQLNSFETAATEVLSEDNPAFDLPPEERFMAAVRGKVWRFSGALRRGIAEILALGATREEESSVGSELRFAGRTAAIVRKVLPPACSWQRWASLGDLLPLLMEAAPDLVLETIEKDIAAPNPQLLELFKQETPGAVTGTIYHSGVLWALETAAWPKERLERLSLCLARLAKLDPGGNWSNRPFASLESLFFSWRPQTVATVSERINALRYLQQKETEQFWKLILRLLPESHEIITDNPKPNYRSWAAGWTGEILQSDYQLFIRSMSSMAVTVAESDARRWPTLLEHINQLSPEDFQRALAGLEKVASQPLPDSLGKELWDKTREIVGRHSFFSDAWWAFPKEEINRMATIRDKFAPREAVVYYAPLFDDDGHLQGDRAESYEEKEARRGRERREAIRKIWETDNEQRVVEFAEKVKLPWAVGWALAAELGDEAYKKIIPAFLVSGTDSICRFAAAFAHQLICTKGADWAEKQPSREWSPDQTAAWALQMDFTPRTWDWTESGGEAVKKAYWSRTGAFGRRNLDLPSRARAAKELQQVGRGWSALQLVMQAKYDKCPLSAEVVCEALESIATNPVERIAGTMDAHYVQEAFEFLQSSKDIDENRVARLEFNFLPLLDRHSGHLPITLQRQLAKEPDFFVDCLKILYRERHRAKSDTQSADETADPEKAEKGKRIWQLLRDWRTIPGTGEDGKVSVESLRAWIREAREKAKEADRSEVCDLTIGELFARSPEDADGAKPLIAIRDVIEECESEELERGFAMGLHNLRGVISKALYEGGKQERDLASKFDGYAKACARWPRTVRALRSVAEDYVRQAEHEDERAKTSK